MIDEINYFPKRDTFQKKKKVEDDWKEMKKLKKRLDGSPASKPSRKPPKPETDVEK